MLILNLIPAHWLRQIRAVTTKDWVSCGNYKKKKKTQVARWAQEHFVKLKLGLEMIATGF